MVGSSVSLLTGNPRRSANRAAGRLPNAKARWVHQGVQTCCPAGHRSDYVITEALGENLPAALVSTTDEASDGQVQFDPGPHTADRKSSEDSGYPPPVGDQRLMKCKRRFEGTSFYA